MDSEYTISRANSISDERLPIISEQLFPSTMSLDDFAKLAATATTPPESLVSQLVTLLPLLGLIPAGEANNLEWRWSRVACVFAGADLTILRQLQVAYDDCPLPLSISTAHQNSGWPTTMLGWSWQQLTSTVPADHPYTAWIHTITLAHIIRYTRLSPEGNTLSVLYDGTRIKIPTDNAASTLAPTPKTLKLLLHALRCPKEHILTTAVATWLQKLPTSSLIRTQPVSTLPGCVLVSPYCALLPAADHEDQPRLRLSGVWLAQGGVIAPTNGDPDDILAYDWPEVAPDPDAARAYAETIPATYHPWQTPAAVIHEAFPQLTAANYGTAQELDAYLNALFCSQLLDPQPRREKPLVLVMPADPDPYSSTNQGKSWLVHALANVLAPGIPLTAVSASDSQTVARKVAYDIRQHGTLCLDEWTPPTAPAHPLAHASLQSLLTGGSISVGQVMSNEGLSVALRWPLFASCKTIHVPPDLLNRSLFFHLEPLTDDQRGAGRLIADITSGKISTRIRLAALALIEKANLNQYITATDTTAHGMRYPVLRACVLALGGTDAGYKKMQAAQRGHRRSADASGLSAQVEANVVLRVSILDLLTDMSYVQWQTLIAVAEEYSTSKSKGLFTLTGILKGRQEVLGCAHLPYYSLLERLTGRRDRVSDRAVQLALAADCKALLIPDVPLQISPDFAITLIQKEKQFFIQITNTPRDETFTT